MKSRIFIALAAANSLFMASCTEETPRPDLVVPTTYVSADFNTNASTEIALVTQLVNLTNEAKKGRTAGAIVAKAKLDSLFQAGSPTLQSIATAYYKGRLEGTGGWFDELAKASGTGYVPGNTVGQGGVYGTGTSAYLFDENGLEMEQMIEKGLFGAAFYQYALTILNKSTITVNDVDRLVAIYGATPAFSNSGSTVVSADVRDRAMANYGARRDKNDGNGFYTNLKKQFIVLKAAIAAGKDYEVERLATTIEIKAIWERINFATVINYCHSVTTTMSKTAPTENEKAAALHAYGECVGFTHGWRTIAAADKTITDTQIDEILTLLNAPYDRTPTSSKFITDPATELPKLQQVIAKLKAIYGFSDAQIEEFKSNWVSVQGR